MADPNIIQVSLPGAGNTISYRLTADTPVQFNFDLAEAIFTGVNGNLEIYVEGGGTIILENYQALADAGTLPTFILMDGGEVPGDVYMLAFDSEEGMTQTELETAAGADTGSSGAGEYSDDPGDLFAGIDALGPQGDAYDAPLVEPLEEVPVEPLEEVVLIPPVAVDDIPRGGEGEHRIIFEDRETYHKPPPGNGYILYQAAFGPSGSSVAGNLLWNDYDDDSVDYPDAGGPPYLPPPPGASTELEVISASFAGTGAYDHGITPPAPGGWTHYDTIHGKYGTLFLYSDADDNGHYIYVEDPFATDPLNNDDLITEVFSYSIIDPDGLTDSATLTVTIQGTNDPPIAFSDFGSVEELGDNNAGPSYSAMVSGNVILGDSVGGHPDWDVDNNDELEEPGVLPQEIFVSQAKANGDINFTEVFGDTYTGDGTAEQEVILVGLYGTLTIRADGSYDYVVDNANPTVDALNYDSRPLIDTFLYTARNDHDPWESNVATLTITIFGNNDAPVAVLDTASVEELGDNNSGPSYSAMVSGNVITGMGPGGGEDTDVDNKDGNESPQEIFVSQARTAAGSFQEVYGDTDTSDGTAAQEIILVGLYGTLTIRADGSYDYVVDNTNTTVDALNYTDTLDDVFYYKARNSYDDGVESNETTLTITINGNNDAPVAVLDTASVEELGDNNSGPSYSAMVSGNVITGMGPGGGEDTDVDNKDGSESPQEIFVSQARTAAGSFQEVYGDTDTSDGTAAQEIMLVGLYGTLTIRADGSYDYVVDNANPTVDALNYTDTLDDVFHYKARNSYGDGVESNATTLTITINGNNDAPVAVLDTASVEERGDNNSGPSYSAMVSGNVITGMGPGGGEDTDVDNKDGSESPQEIFVSQARTAAGSFQEVYGDTDTSDGTAAQEIILVGLYGTLTIRADGSYDYVVDNTNTTVDALNYTDTLDDVFYYKARNTYDDGVESTPTTLTITINGNNDAPVAVLDTASVEELGDNNANPGYTDTVAGNVITGMPPGGGEDTDVDNKDGSESPQEIFVSQARTAAGSFQEVYGDTYTGDGTAAQEIILVGLYGTLTIRHDGSYHYVVDNANPTVDAMNYTDTLDDVFYYKARNAYPDGVESSETTLTITINGNNDAPVAVADAASVEEDGAALLGNVIVGVPAPGGGEDTDVDNNDGAELPQEIFVSQARAAGDVSFTEVYEDTYTGDGTAAQEVMLVGLYGTLTIRADGSYDYVVDNDNPTVDALNEGDTLDDVFHYKARNEYPDGVESNETTLTITIEGINDAPVAVHDGYHEIMVNPVARDGFIRFTGFNGHQYVKSNMAFTALSTDSSASDNDVQLQTAGGTGNLWLGVIDDFKSGNDDEHSIDSVDFSDSLFVKFIDPDAKKNDPNYLEPTPQSQVDVRIVADPGPDHVYGTADDVTFGPILVTVYKEPTLDPALAEQFTFWPDPGENFIHFILNGNDIHAIEMTPATPDTAFFLDWIFAESAEMAIDLGSAGDTGSVVGNVLYNDFDIEGDALSVTDVDSTAVSGGTATIYGTYGSLSIDPNGDYDYTPYDAATNPHPDNVDPTSPYYGWVFEYWRDLGDTVTEVFEYTVSDGNQTDTAKLEFSFNVTAERVFEPTDDTFNVVDEVIFPDDGDVILSGTGFDSIVIDPEYLGDTGDPGIMEIDIMDFSDNDILALGDLVGVNVEITYSNTSGDPLDPMENMHLTFTDIDGSDDIVVNLMGVMPDNPVVQTVEIATSDDLNQLIQQIIDTGNDGF